jgi:hypothetical protein
MLACVNRQLFRHPGTGLLPKKDIEVYRQTGYVFLVDGTRIRIQLKDKKNEQASEV